MSFADHFSGVASSYVRSRPRYPAPLFEWLAARSPARDLAWDAGCGNGQASVALAGRFARVVATDASARQVAEAEPHPRVSYRVARAEEGPGEAGPFDLVTVAQALHWLDLPRFYDAVRAVARPGTLVAAISYGPVRTESREVNAVLKRFDRELHARGHWPPERRLVDEGYAGVPFPFARVPSPDFAMEAEWPLAALRDYVDTWSAVARLRAAGDDELLEGFRRDARAAWGDVETCGIRWPLTVLAGTV